jgi:bifunctional polynucleotide phosphatase/kinase
VIDNTNRNRATRALYVALANQLNVPIRCFYFKTPIELARHNNVYRAFHCPGEGRTLLPGTAFTTYTSAFEPPTEDEGFDELRIVNFVWEGDEVQKNLWMRYMLEVR